MEEQGLNNLRAVPTDSSSFGSNVGRFVVGVLSLMLSCIALLCIGAAAAVAAPPTVTINPLPPAGYTTQSVSGSVKPEGEAATVYAEYATSEAGPFAFVEIAAIPAGKTGSVPVSGQITKLKPATKYFFRLDAEVSGIGETYSPKPYPSATTKAVAKPIVSIEAVSAVNGTAAHFAGHVKPNAPGPAPQDAGFDTTWHFQCTPSCLGLTGGVILGDNVNHAVAETATGLEPNEAYKVALFAENAGGSVETGSKTFSTLKVKPVVLGTFTTSVGNKGATLAAKLDTEHDSTTYLIEYGPTTAYGLSTPASAPLQASPREQQISESLSGLQPGTLYHWRIVATNGAGSTAGSDRSFTTSVLPVPTEACPSNELFRVGPSALLPDCRAYEQASPVDKNAANIQHEAGLVEASEDGSRLTFVDSAGLPTTGGAAKNYVARRSVDQWNTNGLAPLPDPGSGAGAVIAGWDENLRTNLSEALSGGGQALFVGDMTTGTYSKVLKNLPFELLPSVPDFAADPDHLIFESERSLLPGAVSGSENLYDLDQGALTLVGRVPAGVATTCDDEVGEPCVPAAGSFAGPYNWENADLVGGGGARGGYYTKNTLSADGSKVIFTSSGNGKLYVREDGERTVQISASQRTVSDPNGPEPAIFVNATNDGSAVFFLSCEKLTNDSTAVSTASGECVGERQGSGAAPIPSLGGQDLYVFNTHSGALTDLTVDNRPADSNGADVVGFLGASEDGAYVYFAANGVLAPGASPGDCPPGSFTDPNVAATCNIYLEHDGVTSFVSAIDAGGDGSGERFSGGSENWQAKTENVNHGVKSSRVSENGVLLFDSTQELTGYNSSCSAGAGACAELFRYDPAGHAIDCVSCNPSGASPAGNAQLVSKGNTIFANIRRSFLTRNLNAEGDRVFFDSPDALVPADINRVTDPYEWEAVGTGSCSSATADGGCIYLLSTGSDPHPSFFGDASKSGNDVFIFTDQGLVAADRDALTDAYDVRVGGGLASQNSSPSTPCESGAACAGPTVNPPAALSPGTANFTGPGNRVSRKRNCLKRGKPKPEKDHARRCGKPDKARRHRKDHRHHEQSATSRATNNRRGGSK